MKKRDLGWLLVPAGAALCGFVYWMVAGAAKQRPPVTPDEIATLRSELRSLRTEQGRLVLLATQAASRQLPPGMLEPGDRTPPAGSAESSDRTPEKKTAPAQEDDAIDVEAAIFLDKRFDAERSDPGWSQTATREATRALSSTLPPGTTLQRVECRTDLCRVESNHTNMDAFQAYTKACLLSRQRQIWNGGFSAMVRSESASGVTAVTYIAREGQAVPVPDP